MATPLTSRLDGNDYLQRYGDRVVIHGTIVEISALPGKMKPSGLPAALVAIQLDDGTIIAGVTSLRMLVSIDGGFRSAFPNVDAGPLILGVTTGSDGEKKATLEFADAIPPGMPVVNVDTPEEVADVVKALATDPDDGGKIN